MKTTLKIIIAAFVLAGFTGCAGIQGDEQFGVSGEEVTGRPYVELFRSEGNSKYYFNLVAKNHEIILSSQGYGTRTSALKGILAVLENAGSSANFDVKKARNGDYYFNLLAGNNKIIGTSQLYSTKSNAKRGVTAVIGACEDYEAHLAKDSGARYDFFVAVNGDHYFNLHAKNGEIVLSSEGYSTQAAAWNGALSVSENGLDLDSYEINEAENGAYYINLVAPNGETIATSELYSTKGNAKAAAEAIADLIADVAVL